LASKIWTKNSQPFEKNVRKPQEGFFLTHTVQCTCVAVHQRLTFLDVSDNEINVLPPKFGDLKWLRVARLTRNHVVDMRPAVGMTACQELNLSQNQITQIPDTISNMTSLVTLDLSYNGLTVLHPAICLVSTPICYICITISFLCLHLT